MKRPWARWLMVSGLALILASLVYDVIYAGIPYQDPTPEMQARYDAHRAIATMLFWCGAGVGLVGAFVWVARKMGQEPS